LKQPFRYAVWNHNINQRIPHQIITENNVKKFHPAFADELFKTEFLDDDDAINDVVFVQSEHQILSKGFGDECECAHGRPRVKFEWSVGLLEYWGDGFTKPIKAVL
jgi:hypothetical protein